MYFATSVLSGHPQQKAGAIQTAEEPVQIGDDFNREERAILTSPLLTQQGKTEQLGRLATDSKRQLDAFERKTVGVLKQRKADAFSAVALAAVASITKADPADALVAVLREQEARAAARQIDPLMLQAKYRVACREGSDDALIAAIEGAPSFAPVLSPEIVAEGKQARMARLRPDTALFDELIAFYTYVINAVRNELQRHLPPAPPELIRVQAI
jgi:hypothetical protein